MAGARDLVCMKNFGVIGRAQTAPMCQAKVILKGSKIVTCYLLGREGEAEAERENYRALFSW